MKSSTIEQEELHLPDVAVDEPESMIEETHVAIGVFAQTKSSAIRETIMKVVQFSEQVSQELDLDPLDETIILSETGLMLLYPIENLGTMSVAAPKEDQGMMRWNCKEALEKMTEILSP